mmetsp:Transcript_3662/g.4814  ORF Transcript_3662/g.4814 Transcript_3662/m.4814 type:complete len:563 (+) Transcript_3662:201-1889(+)
MLLPQVKVLPILSLLFLSLGLLDILEKKVTSTRYTSFISTTSKGITKQKINSSSRTIATATATSATINVSNNYESSESKSDNNIVILGGGFGGLNAALTLDSLPWDEHERPNIILVDKKERFVFLPLLYELCVGDAELEEVAPTFKSLLKNTNNIQFLQRNIQGIDKDNQQIYLTNKQQEHQSPTECIPYKSLIIATGADINLSSIPGTKEYALPFYTVEDCYELRKRLSLLDELIKSQIRQKLSSSKDDNDISFKVVIVGGGYSGVELALNLKERLNYSNLLKRDDKKNSDINVNIEISILHRANEVLQYATDYNRVNGQQRLKDANIELLTKRSVVEVLPPAEQNDLLDDNSTNGWKGRCRIIASVKGDEQQHNDTLETIDADLLLWTAGAMSKNEPRGILNSKLPRDANGRIVTNQYLQVKDETNVFALGDCARVKRIPHGATAAVAMQQAPVVAWNAFSSMNQEDNKIKNLKNVKLDLLPFDYLNLGEMMTLGGDDATIAGPSRLFQLDGSVASIARRLIYAVRMPTLQQALTAAKSSTSKRLEKSSLEKVEKVINWK